MGGFFGVASKQDCVLELFYGVDYHSHLGTRRGGMAVYGEDGFYRAIHNIENSPFRTKFDHDVSEMKGYLGIGCISDYDPQPLLIQSHLGSFAITTVGKVNNYEELLKGLFEKDHSHFQEMTNGQINVTELVAALICEKESIVEGIKYVQDVVDGSMTMLVMTKEGIYGARDRYGRTPLVIGKKDDSYCLSFESHAYINLGYTDYKELGPCEVVYVTSEGVEEIRPARTGKMKICSFLWVYYGYPTSAYEGVNVEEMRYRCGSMLAKRDGDSVHPDIVAGVPDSGIAHAIGYANESGIPYVAVSLGGEGALLVCEEGIYHGKPPKIQVVNTVGCGDSMVGGFAVALKRNYRAEEALSYAVAVSAANALSPNTGDFDPVEYQKIYDKVVVEKLR